jgi:hypothetical protein
MVMRATLAPYLPLLAVVLAGLVGQVRAYMPAAGFWHSNLGHGLLSLGGALLGLGASVAAKGDLSKGALLMALTGAAATYFSATKPIGTAAANEIRPGGQSGRTNLTVVFTLASIVVCIVAIGALLIGCAPGVDGLRQACATTDDVITSGYQSVVSWDHTVGAAIRSDVAAVSAETKPTATEISSLRDRLATHQGIVNKVLAALDAAVSAKKAACGLIPAIESGQKKDVPSLIQAVVQVAANVQEAVKLIGGAV